MFSKQHEQTWEKKLMVACKYGNESNRNRTNINTKKFKEQNRGAREWKNAVKWAEIYIFKFECNSMRRSLLINCFIFLVSLNMFETYVCN